jgi:hypothetical protein
MENNTNLMADERWTLVRRLRSHKSSTLMKTSGFIRDEEFLGVLRGHEFLMKDSAPWDFIVYKMFQ